MLGLQTYLTWEAATACRPRLAMATACAAHGLRGNGLWPRLAWQRLAATRRLGRAHPSRGAAKFISPARKRWEKACQMTEAPEGRHINRTRISPQTEFPTSSTNPEFLLEISLLMMFGLVADITLYLAMLRGSR